MTTPADLALAATFQMFGVASTYTPPGGGVAVDCRIVRDTRDRRLQMGGQPTVEGKVFEVRFSEVAAPRKAGTFTIDAVVSRIVDDPSTEDPDRLVWICTVR